MKKETYASSGVQIDKAEAFVSRIKSTALREAHKKLWKAAGGYAAVYPLQNDLAVALTTDGVGTKLLVAHELQDYKGLGIDLVAMCANDLICVGAAPEVFLDYYAVGCLDDQVSDLIIDGIVEGCDQAGMILGGGETAEMPGVYEPGHFDLAGFAMGSLSRAQLLSGDTLKPGQSLVAVASSGIHSNGLSLARKVLPRQTWNLLLEPTAIYVKAALCAMNKLAGSIKGIVHITGGGWRNLLRLNPEVGFQISKPLPLPEVFSLISAQVETEEMYKTFNMGMGLALIVDSEKSAQLVEIFQEHGHQAQVAGELTDEAGTVRIDSYDFVLHDKHSK